MTEEHLYWALVDARWVDDANFAKGPLEFFRRLPALLRPIAVPLIRRKIRNALHAQGMGRHAPAQIGELGVRSIDAMADSLGNKPFFMGAEPTGVDATIFAFTVGVLCPTFETPLRSAAERHANLKAYVARMIARYYPDWPRPG